MGCAGIRLFVSHSLMARHPVLGAIPFHLYNA
jgi:hypothetical protein